VDVNSAVGRRAGLSDDKLQAVGGNDLSLFSDVERLAIALAGALSDTPSNVPDSLYARLRDQFSEEPLIELGAQIAFEQYRARFNRVFDVGSDALYRPGERR
jgi:alkylhydroperoxidase family enzyme